MNNKNKLWALLLVMALVVATLAGCASQPSGGSAAPQSSDNGGGTAGSGDKILKMGLSGIEGIFNPILADTTYDAYVNSCIFEGLVTLAPNGEYVENLAASYTLSEDHRTYTFTLKDGITFSDGTPLTTKDVEFTYKTAACPEYTGARAYIVSGLEGYDAFHNGDTEEFPGIKVIDEKTIAFTYAQGMEAPGNIENFQYGIMSADYYAFDTWEEFTALNEKPMGTGIMTFDSWAPKQFVKLNKNANYWDSANAAKIDGVLMSEVPDTSILQALQTGEIDFAMPSASADNVNALKGMDNITFQSYLGNGYTYMCFNTTRDTLSDVRVRQALMYALNRKEFINAEYGSEELAQVGMAPISPVSWAYPDPASLNAYDFDLDKAAQLMDEAGWTMGDDGFRYKDGKKFSINWLVYTESTWTQTLSSMAADTWKQLGVELNIELMDFNTVASRTTDPAPADKDFDIYTMGFSLGVDPDPSGALFDADAYVEGGFNASGYRNDRAQELIKQGKAEFDNEKRKPIYAEFAQLMNQEIPTIIVAYRSEIWGINNRVHGMDLQTYKDWTACLKDITLD
ncbi:MAG: ABC transporter substrate-binding protein [Christensenellales bacterium]|jgi:peptide/nickel transport system substrate-binding protein